MMKSRIWMLPLLMLMSLSILTGCNKDGDETIALEMGNARKMIVGPWKIRVMEPSDNKDFVYDRWKPGTRLVFYDDGSYTDDSDGKRHLWKLPNGDDDRHIRLDNWDFEYELSGRLWVLHYPSEKPKWIIKMEKDDDDSDNNQPPVKEEYEYRVSKIVSHSNPTALVTYRFSYDSKGRIIKYEMPSNTYTYQYENGYVYLCDASGHTLKTCRLNSDGYISSDETTSASNVFFAGLYEYKNGYLSTIRADYGTYLYNFSVNNPGEMSFSVTAGHEFFFYHISSNKNDSNIDLNPFVSYFWEYDRLRLSLPLKPFDFYGKRYNIIAGENNHGADFYYDSYQVERNSDGLISRISYKVLNSHDGKTLRDAYIEVFYEKIKK
jgi:hypothetical protein